MLAAEEIELRALEIARDDFEIQLREAERHAEEEQDKRRRLKRRRQYASQGEDPTQALLDIPCDVWLPVLTGIEMPRGRRISCPLPGHEDKDPSCRFYDATFYCWGCHRSGDIFNFVGELWEIDHRGSRFPELVKMLAMRLLR